MYFWETLPKLICDDTGHKFHIRSCVQQWQCSHVAGHCYAGYSQACTSYVEAVATKLIKLLLRLFNAVS